MAAFLANCGFGCNSNQLDLRVTDELVKQLALHNFVTHLAIGIRLHVPVPRPAVEEVDVEAPQGLQDAMPVNQSSSMKPTARPDVIDVIEVKAQHELQDALHEFITQLAVIVPHPHELHMESACTIEVVVSKVIHLHQELHP